MSALRFTTLLTLFFWSFTAWANAPVRVLLDEDRKPIELSVRSPVQLTSAHETIFINYPKADLRFVRDSQGWVIFSTYKKIKENYRMSGKTLEVSSLTLDWKKHPLSFPVRLNHAAGKYSLVGVMGMNEYLRGVVEHEMPSSWPIEALKAQVVASRTYALWKMRQQKNEIYDLRPSVLDQVFRLRRGNESTSLPPSIERALSETDDLHLVDANNKVVNAYFHSDCGGATSSAAAVWGYGDKSSGSARDLACEQRRSDWSSRWPANELYKKFQREFVLPSDLKLMDVVIRAQSESQRIEWMDLIFSKGIFKRIRGEDIRRILGYDKVKSTLFAVQKTGDVFVFEGRGFGHGVGMCQWGAKAMAASGKNFQSILAHYYPGSRLQQETKAPTTLSWNSEFF